MSSIASAPKDTPPAYIPGLNILGSTYDVLNGKYADSRSSLQQVIQWDKVPTRSQVFGRKEYIIPRVVNYTTNTTSDFRSSHGKTVTEYTKSLSIHAGLEGEYPGFSASASADYSESQRQNVSNAFTRIAYNVTHYNLSLPPLDELRSLLKPSFVHKLDNKDPLALYKEYGTHLLRSLTIGGRALFLYSTDIRQYSSEMSIEAAAKVSASYGVASGSIELSAAEKKAMASLNESSQTAVVTKGGDPRYGNEEFLKNGEAWAASIVDYPEFVDFGSLPAFFGLWELASTPARRDTLQKAVTEFVTRNKKDLELPGPLLKSRFTNDFDPSMNVELMLSVFANDQVILQFPRNRSGPWFVLSGGAENHHAVIASEIVPGALAPVKWEEAFTELNVFLGGSKQTKCWRAVPPSEDYVALGSVGVTVALGDVLPAQPPDRIASRFRAVHKRALMSFTTRTPTVIKTLMGNVVYGLDDKFWFTDTQVPPKPDHYVLDPAQIKVESANEADTIDGIEV